VIHHIAMLSTIDFLANFCGHGIFITDSFIQEYLSIIVNVCRGEKNIICWLI